MCAFLGSLEFRIAQFMHATFSGQLDGSGWVGIGSLYTL